MPAVRGSADLLNAPVSLSENSMSLKTLAKFGFELQQWGRPFWAAAALPCGVPASRFGFVVRRLETGMKLRMKESHRKGVANHPDPESCVASHRSVDRGIGGPGD